MEIATAGFSLWTDMRLMDAPRAANSSDLCDRTRKDAHACVQPSHTNVQWPAFAENARFRRYSNR